MKKIFGLLFFAIALAACEKVDTDPVVVDDCDYVYILNEGSWGGNNATLSLYSMETGIMSNSVFSSVNGTPLGDTGNDIITTDDMVIMAINTSNIIQFCDLKGKALAQSEEVPGCRKLASDGKYLYVTSYANDGYVAKIDLSTYKVVATVNVGYEPEGIVYWKGKLYVANSGGYAYLGTHSYEQTISIVDASTMKETKRVDTGHVNLYGGFVQNAKYPRYILVNAAGDYASNLACSMVFDCESESVVKTFDFPATYASQYEGSFYCLGSSFSYSTYTYEYYCNKIDMSTGSPVVTEGLAPSVPSASDGIVTAVKSMTAPYGLFVAPTGDVFIADAGDYSSRGYVYRFGKDGSLLAKEAAGVCPAHFAAK